MSGNRLAIEGDRVTAIAPDGDQPELRGVAVTEYMERHDEHVSTTRLEARVKHLEAALRWMMQASHQAYHAWPIEECPRNTCDYARRVLRGEL